LGVLGWGIRLWDVCAKIKPAYSMSGIRAQQNAWNARMPFNTCHLLRHDLAASPISSKQTHHRQQRRPRQVTREKLPVDYPDLFNEFVLATRQKCKDLHGTNVEFVSGNPFKAKHPFLRVHGGGQRGERACISLSLSLSLWLSRSRSRSLSLSLRICTCLVSRGEWESQRAERAFIGVLP
jgi:hypothetical protein